MQLYQNPGSGEFSVTGYHLISMATVVYIFIHIRTRHFIGLDRWMYQKPLGFGNIEYNLF